MHANNEIGTIQDIKAIGDICKEYNAIFHSDTVQTIAHYPFDMQELNVDFMAASAHKFHGPKGVGFVYISEDIQIKPLSKRRRARTKYACWNRKYLWYCSSWQKLWKWLMRIWKRK